MSANLQYYLEHGIMTEVEAMKSMITDIPQDIPTIVSYVQNVLLHQHWASRYGVELSNERKKEPNLRSIEEKLAFLQQLGCHHVANPQPLEKKIIAICRDFSVMAAALCREAGIPARARCGFATYFTKGKFIDHWIVEYWNAIERRWVMVDAQLDQFQQQQLGIVFDPLDVSREYFITGDRAWRSCRAGEWNPQHFGIFQWWGYEYLICNLLLDVNSLLKVPMQPWDGWHGYKTYPISEWQERDYVLIDQLAELTGDVDIDFNAFCEFVAKHDTIKVPTDFSKVINFLA